MTTIDIVEPSAPPAEKPKPKSAFAKMCGEPKVANMSKIKADNLLFDACKTGNLDDAKKAVACGADINLVRDYRTPLIWASIEMRLDIIEYLAELDVDVNKIVDGETALSHAVECGFPTVAKMLIRHGAEVNGVFENGLTILCRVARTDNVELAKVLIKYGGAKIDYQVPETKMYPLYIAFSKSRMEMGKLLLGLGAKWSGEVRNGKSAWSEFSSDVQGLIKKHSRHY